MFYTFREPNFCTSRVIFFTDSVNFSHLALIFFLHLPAFSHIEVCTMHANMVFATDYILPPNNNADVYLCDAFSLEDIAFKRCVTSRHQIYAFPMLNIKY